MIRISRRWQIRLWASMALALGLALRIWFIGHAANIAGDTLVYGDIAKNWFHLGIYGFAMSGPTPLPTLIRLPGYPLFLAACFHLFGIEHYTAVMYVQAIIDLLTCLLISALATRLFGRRSGMAALWLSALCPFTASYVAAPLTETLSLFCIALTFYALERWQSAGMHLNRWLWITSLAMTYAVLLRPEQGLLPAAVVPAMLWMILRSRSQPSNSSPNSSPKPNPNPNPKPSKSRLQLLSPVLFAALCVLLPLVPWTVRNWRTFHVFQPLAPRYATDPGEPVPLGFQRWFRTWAIDFASTEDVYWNYDGAHVEISDLPTRAFDSDDQYTRTDALLTAYNRTNQPRPEFDARFAALAEERIQADPLRYYVALPVARVIDMFLRPRTEMLPVSVEWWKWRERPSESAFTASFGLLNLAYFALAGFGLRLWHRRGWDDNPTLAWSMIGFLILRCALLLTLDNSEPRYTLEFFPLILVWSAVVFSNPKPSSTTSA